jgi:hypothetical protein
VRNPQGFAPTVISTALFCRLTQLLEEFAFGLLHALGGFGIADRSSDALENGDGESLA